MLGCVALYAGSGLAFLRALTPTLTPVTGDLRLRVFAFILTFIGAAAIASLNFLFALNPPTRGVATDADIAFGHALFGVLAAIALSFAIWTLVRLVVVLSSKRQ